MFVLFSPIHTLPGDRDARNALGELTGEEKEGDRAPSGRGEGGEEGD